MNMPQSETNFAAAAGLSILFEGIVGVEGYTEDRTARTLFSQDIWTTGVDAAFIVSPANTDELAAVVRAACQHNIALNPRGAGMSYTKGYIPDRPGVGVLDMTRMDKILEINEEDMYVTVEAGCSWRALHDALKPKGLRTPFWGPLSGITSTIGGGLSQNNAFFGAGTHGTTGDSVLSVTVVLGDGSVVRTGSAGAKQRAPFFRHYGPDLTGLFCGDAGALGFKAEITLRLIPFPEHEDWASYEFVSRDDCANAMQALMRENLACEIFGFDPNLQNLRLKRASLLADAKALGNVMKGQGSLISGLKEGAKIALAGRNFVNQSAYSLHFVVEGRSRTGVREHMAHLKKIATGFGGKAIENSIPKIIRANPFAPMNNVIGPEGERWAPVHGIVSPSNGAAAWAAIDAMFKERHEELEDHGILTGFLVTTIGSAGFLIEPVFFWPEALNEIHRQTVEPEYLASVTPFEPRPQTTELVAELRQAVIDVFSRFGAAHFQIGRTYPYKETRLNESWALLEAIKNAVDEKGIINPGALGLTPNQASNE